MLDLSDVDLGGTKLLSNFEREKFFQKGGVSLNREIECKDLIFLTEIFLC